MSENPNADIGTAENNTEVQSNQPQSGLNQESLADLLRDTLFRDDEQAGQPQPDNEGEDQTEVKDTIDSEASQQDEVTDTELPPAEDGEDEVHSQSAEDNGEDDNLSKGVQKRIDKLTAKRKQAEEEATRLRNEVDSLKQELSETKASGEANKTSVTDASNPFASLNTKADVEKEVEQARWLRYKCMENPNGFVMGDTEYGPEDVSRMLVNATKAIEVHLPKQMSKIQTYEAVKPIAEAEYPWWKTPQAKEYQLAQQVINNFPQFKNHPDYMLFVGDYVRGFLARESKSPATGVMRKAPIQSVRPTAAPVKTSAKTASAKNAESRFVRSNNAENLAKVLLSKGFI
jgi:hypothetical protein